MRRVEKEILKREQSDFGAAYMIATKAGYFVEVFDGDGENGPCEPALFFNRAEPVDEQELIDRYEAEFDDGSSIGCSDCPEDECTGHCMSCSYRSL